jgi:hypothetical protein
MSVSEWLQPSAFSLMYQTRVLSMSRPPAGSGVSARLWMNGAVFSENHLSIADSAPRLAWCEVLW